MKDTVFLTGATGFLGTELVLRLVASGTSSGQADPHALHQPEGYILAPYMDHLSFFFNKDWRLPMRDMASIMIKLADEEKGSISGKKIDKQFLGTLNAGYPGGILPFTEAEKDSLYHTVLPDNLYVADATILQKAMGNPLILTIMAVAKKIAAAL